MTTNEPSKLPMMFKLSLRDLFWLVLVMATFSKPLAQADPPQPPATATKHLFLFNPTEEDWKRIDPPEKVRWLQLLAVENDEGVSDANIERVAAFSNVEVLLLGCPKLTDEALRPIVKLKKLRLVAIQAGQFTDDGIQQLARLPNLEVIAFCDVAISEQAVAKLQKAIPSAEIESVRTGTSGKFHEGGCLTSEFLRRAKPKKPGVDDKP